MAILMSFQILYFILTTQLSKAEFPILQECLRETSSVPEHQSEIHIPKNFSSIGKTLTFTLGPFLLHHCAEHHNKTLHIDIRSGSRDEGRYQFTPLGFFIGPSGINQNALGQNYSTNDYCITSATKESLEISICNVNCGYFHIPCIPKCCHENELYDTESDDCVVATRKWVPSLKPTTGEPFTESQTSEFKFHILPKLRHCYISISPQITTDQHFIKSTKGRHVELRLLTSGELLTKLSTENEWKPYGREFCLDGDSQSNENVLVDLEDCPEIPESMLPIGEGNITATRPSRGGGNYGYNESRADFQTWVNIIHATLMVLSSVFLLSSMMIYISLWEKQNTHGWTVLSYITSLFFAYIFLAIYKFIAAFGSQKNGLGCLLNGILAHFFFESVFTWLTVINFDIWWKFWDLKSKPNRGTELGRYLTYALFAFGIPLLIIVIGLILQKSGSGIPPGYGENGCFLQSSALGVYLYYPIGVLMGLNFIFFISTSVKIYAHFKTTSHVHEEKAQQEFESCKVIVKLFVVMGVTWVFELLSFFFVNEESSRPMKIMWGILDCANILQALGIFYIFIWKRLILTQLWHKYPFLRPFLKSLKGLPGCKKRVDYRSSSRVTTKSKKTETASQKQERKERNRKLSDSEQRTSFETIELVET